MSFEWEQAYRLLVENYGKLAEDCSKAVLLSDSLRVKIEIITKENEQLRAKKMARWFANEANQVSSLFPAHLEPEG